VSARYGTQPERHSQVAESTHDQLFIKLEEPEAAARVIRQAHKNRGFSMAPHTLQQVAHARIAEVFMLGVAAILMIAPFVISLVANIGRRPWPSYRREAVEAKPRAMLSAPRVAA